MRRSIILAFILILTASSLIMVKPIWAQTTLSVPEFTVKYADYSYDIPASTSIDPFTGSTLENPAHHVDNRTLTFTIKNQTVRDGQLHYYIRMKGHFSENWTNTSDGFEGLPSRNSSPTVWVFLPKGEEGRLYPSEGSGGSFHLPSVGQVDFQVKAQTWGEVMATRSPQNPFGGSITTLFAESDWSSTQTIMIPEPLPSESPSTSPTQTQNPAPSVSPSPSIPEFPSGIVLLLAMVTLTLAVVVAIRKRSKQRQKRYRAPFVAAPT